jgi:uncharacterized protein with gpF-like domain
MPSQFQLSLADREPGQKVLPSPVRRYSKPGPIPQEALDFFKAKGIKPSFNWQDVWQAEHRTAFTVARITELDVLLDMRKATEKAIADGQGFADFQKEVRPILERSGWMQARPEMPYATRVQTIFDTNMRMARATGQWERIQRTKAVIPYLMFTSSSSLHPRSEHEAWVGTVLPVDHPWWETHMPPCAWGCKHGVLHLTKEMAEKQGGVTETPPSYDVPWENTVTGETGMAPVGVDPSFAYPKSAGARTAACDKALKDREEEWNK